MKQYLISAALVFSGTQALAQAVTPAPALPANIQADRAAIVQQATALQSAVSQLQADERAGNANALGADHTLVQLDRMQLRMDFGQLHRDAEPLLQPDATALFNAVKQMHSDQVAGNSGALQADEAAIQNAETQLKTARQAIYEGLHFGFHRGHRPA